MAELRFIDPRSNPTHTANLITSLQALPAAGADPGPRDVQIRGLGEALTRSVLALRTVLSQLGLTAEETGIDLQLQQIEATAELARAYDPHERGR